MHLFKLKKIGSAILIACLLTACGGSSNDSTTKASFVPADGQVSVVTGKPTSVNAFAAARFLEQASWGATPATVAEVQRLGIEAWIDQQLGLRASVLNAPNYVIDYDDNNRAARDLAWQWSDKSLYDLPLSSQDQLRQRTTWALYNFIVFGQNGFALDRIEYFNAIQANSLGSFFLLAW